MYQFGVGLCACAVPATKATVPTTNVTTASPRNSRVLMMRLTPNRWNVHDDIGAHFTYHSSDNRQLSEVLAGSAP